jgi:hypothetical protein
MYHASEMGLDIEFEQQVVEFRLDGSRMSIREQALALIDKIPESQFGPASSLRVAAATDV